MHHDPGLWPRVCGHDAVAVTGALTLRFLRVFSRVSQEHCCVRPSAHGIHTGAGIAFDELVS